MPLRVISFLIVLLSFHSEMLRGQNSYVDSLKHVLENEKLSPQTRVDNLIRLGVELVFVNSKDALEYAQQGLNLAQSLAYKQGEASAYRIIGAIYSTQDNYITGSDYIQRGLRIFENLADTVGIANSYISLGHTFSRQKNYAVSVNYHRSSYRIFKKLGIPDRIGVTAHNFAEALLEVGKIDSAYTIINEGIHYNTILNRRSVLSSCYKVLGRICLAQSDVPNAEKSFKRAIEINEDLGVNAQKVAYVQSLIELSKIYEKQAKSNLQIQSLLKAFRISKEYNVVASIDDLYDNIIGYYLSNGQLNKARFYLQESISVLDSINTQQQLDRSELMLSAIRGYKLEEEAQALAITNNLQTELIKQQRLQIYLILLFLLIIVAAVIGTVTINARLKRSNKMLEEQKDFIDKQNRELEELNSTKDKFFGIISHDLRGPVGGVKQLLEMYFNEPESIPDELKPQIREQIITSLNNTYKLLINLITWSKLQMGGESSSRERVNLQRVVMSIMDVYQQIAKEKRIQILSEVDASLHINIDENHLDLIIRNLVNNALKYSSEGGIVHIKAIRMDSSRIRISISDQGVGIPKPIQHQLFNITESSSMEGTKGELGTGLGLVLCHDFVKVNNGQITFESEEGKGTTFHVDLPTNVS